MRVIIIVLVVLVAFAGGAGGAYFYFMQPAEASVGEEHKEEEKHAEKGKGDKKGKDGGYGAIFVELDPLILPIVDNDGVNQVVSMVIALEVKDSAAEITVKGMKPKLKDAYIQDMYGVLNRHAALKGGVVQVNKIKKRLNKITNHVLGEDVVKDVLLQVVQQRPS